VIGRLAPSGFVVQPDIADPLCNGGHGVRLRGPFGGRKQAVGHEESVRVRAGTLADGSTLIAFTAGGYEQEKSFAILDSIAPTCTWDSGFGDGGTAMIAIPSGFRSEHAPHHNEEGRAIGPEGLDIEAVAARNGGGAIIAGSYKGAWLLGEVTARGHLDPTFGQGGWSALPFEGAVTKILQEPSGRIIIAGGEHFSGCCTLNWAAALSASGRLERSFGTHGRVKLPIDESANIQELLREPDGDILIEVGHGNMGCWGTSLALFTPSGQPVPQFAGFVGGTAGQTGRFWQDLGLHAFIGDSYIEGEGFTVIGTGQKPCYDEPPGSTAPATGLLARFRPNGEPDGPTIRFPSRMYGTVLAFRDGGDVVLVESPYSDRTQVTVTARHADGALDPRFGNLGQAQIRIPLHSRELNPEALEFIKAAPGEITLVATPREHAEVQLIRLRL
jgi:hypothetical protein